MKDMKPETEIRNLKKELAECRQLCMSLGVPSLLAYLPRLALAEKKIVPNPKYGTLGGATFMGLPNEPEFLLEPVSEGSEYFVMRLDEGGSDIHHISACRIGIHAYADAIEGCLPQLAKDLRERYPLIDITRAKQEK